MDSSNLKAKKVLIFGLGLLGGGLSAAEFFAKHGSIVTVTDLKTEKELQPSLKKLKKFKIKYVLGRHQNEDILNADLIIKNPAIPSDSPYLKLAEKHKIPVETEASYFLKFYPYPENIIGVTGTRGKTTTTMMITSILKKAGYKVLVGGNIEDTGTLSLLDNRSKAIKIVLELSSWQLAFSTFSPHIAVITNIYEDHLNRYKTMVDYISDKKKMFLYQNPNDFLILNQNNPYTKKFAKDARSKVIFSDSLKIKLKLLGNHNLENAAAAFEVAKILKIPDEIIYKALKNFNSIPGRLEIIRELNGVTFINDTTSTTPIAGACALKSINKPIILIAGGFSKNLNMSLFAKEILERVKSVVLLNGTGTENLKKLILPKVKGKVFDDYEKAILFAKSLAKKGDVVLLSPGYASFGMFTNEHERGRKFNEIVKNLK